jgi:hypothetical protein
MSHPQPPPRAQHLTGHAASAVRPVTGPRPAAASHRGREVQGVATPG